MESFTAEGRWWLPASSEQVAPGTFTFQDGDASLTVYEALEPAEDNPQAGGRWDHVTHPVVHGRTHAGDDITLFSARGIVHRTPRPWGSSKSTYHVAAGARRRHLPNDAFSAASFQLDYLPAWLNPPPMIDQPDYGTLRVDLGARVLADVSLADGHLEICTTMTGTWDPGVSLESTTSVLVRPSIPLSYTDLLNNWVRPFEDLLTLTLDRRVCLTHINVEAPGDSDRDRSADLFYANAGLAPAGAASLSDIVGMGSGTLLWAGDSPLALPDLLLRWFEFYEDLRPIIVPLLGRHYAPFMYGEHELVSTANAAEALHRRRFDSRQVPRAEHRARVRSIIDAAAASAHPEHLAWAERVLTNANSKPLAERLNEILQATGTVGDAIVAAEPDFSGHIVGLRTTVAHGDASSKSGLSYAERFRHDQALRWVLRCYLIGELIGDHAEAQRRTGEKESFKFAVRRLADPEGTD